MKRRKSSVARLAIIFSTSTLIVSAVAFLLNTQVLHREDLKYKKQFLSETESVAHHVTKKKLECNNTLPLQHNSMSWLHTARLGNSRHSVGSLTFQKVAAEILNLPSTLRHASTDSNSYLSQAISHPSSSFRITSDHASDRKAIRLWQVKLTYLAIFYHQNRHAIEEAKLRKTNECNASLSQNKIFPYDYECPEAKYLVVGLGKLGLGANLRSAAVKALMAGLATDRVVLFVNTAKPNTPQTRTPDMGPWPLASCPRRDHQCFFLPISPCVLKEDDLVGAHILNKQEMRNMIRQGIQPSGRENDRVLIMHLKIAPQLDIPKPAISKLQLHARVFLSHVPESDPRRATIQHAISTLSEPDVRREIGYNYAQSNTRIHHGLMFYAMRPNEPSASAMDKIVGELRASARRQLLVGLPIRASDKCNHESECLTFEQHIGALSTVKDQFGPLTKSTILFTTESADMLSQKEDYMENVVAKNESFQILTNPYDVLPSTGYVEEVNYDEAKFTADDTMLSAVTNLQLQLSANYTLANCCSNFHTLIGDFLIEGMGASPTNTFRCLQEHPSPQYAICCGWHGDCKRRRKAYFLNTSIPDSK